MLQKVLQLESKDRHLEQEPAILRQARERVNNELLQAAYTSLVASAASASEADDAPKTMLSGWDALYDEPPLRIALAVNDSWRGQSAFAFPLMGRRLQHTVSYVPVSGDAAMAAMPPTRRVGTKLFTIEGLHAETGEYEQIRPGQRYSAFQAGLQLANRNGPMNEIEFSEYVVKTQAFADAVDAPLVANMTEFGQSPLLPLDKLASLG